LNPSVGPVASDGVSPVAAMLRVSRAAAGGDLAEVLAESVRAARMVIQGASAASILIAAPTPSGLRLAAAEGLSAGYCRALESSPDLLKNGATEEAMQTREVVWVSDTQTDRHSERVRDLTREEGILSLLAVPLFTKTAVVGALGVYRSRVGCWTDEEIDLLMFFAEHAAGAVQNTQLMTEREEQLAGMTRLVATLRAQGHEHANRLHALQGLLMMGEPEEALRLLGELLAAHHFVRSELGATISHPILAGLLLAESAVAAQRNIDLQIDPASTLAESPRTLGDFQLVTLVGNLLDNAFDAVEEMSADRRVVRVFASDTGATMRISIRDFGMGLTRELDELTESGMTTKDGHVGEGLALVRVAAEVAMGTLEVTAHEDGTTFTVTVPFTPPALPTSGGTLANA
jgi:GAF domain-containing protein